MSAVRQTFQAVVAAADAELARVQLREQPLMQPLRPIRQTRIHNRPARRARRSRLPSTSTDCNSESFPSRVFPSGSIRSYEPASRVPFRSLKLVQLDGAGVAQAVPRGGSCTATG